MVFLLHPLPPSPICPPHERSSTTTLHPRPTPELPKRHARTCIKKIAVASEEILQNNTFQKVKLVARHDIHIICMQQARSTRERLAIEKNQVCLAILWCCDLARLLEIGFMSLAQNKINNGKTWVSASPAKWGKKKNSRHMGSTASRTGVCVHFPILRQIFPILLGRPNLLPVFF